MTDNAVVHSTITIERDYPAAPARVFAAWSDPKIKRRWFAQSEGAEVLAFEMDFRVGGRERARFRVRGDAEFTNDTIYQDIVPDQRIVIAYTMSSGERRISASLGTVELRPTDGGTRMLYTEQAAFFAGGDGPKLREQGWRELFARLAGALAVPR